MHGHPLYYHPMIQSLQLQLQLQGRLFWGVPQKTYFISVTRRSNSSFLYIGLASIFGLENNSIFHQAIIFNYHRMGMLLEFCILGHQTKSN